VVGRHFPGETAYRTILHKSRPLPANSPEVRRVRDIGDRIAQAAAIEPLQRESNLRLKG
jgi:hypothetical protein